MLQFHFCHILNFSEGDPFPLVFSIDQREVHLKDMVAGCMVVPLITLEVDPWPPATLPVPEVQCTQARGGCLLVPQFPAPSLVVYRSNLLIRPILPHILCPCMVFLPADLGQCNSPRVLSGPVSPCMVAVVVVVVLDPCKFYRSPLTRTLLCPTIAVFLHSLHLSPNQRVTYP